MLKNAVMGIVMLLLPVLAYSAISCAQVEDNDPSLPYGVVAIVNGHPIAQSEVDAIAVNSEVTPDVKNCKAIKRQLIARALLQQQAEARHFDQSNDVLRAVRRVRDDMEIKLLLESELPKPSIPDAAVRQRYDLMRSQLGPEEYLARIISLPSAVEAASVMASLGRGDSFEDSAKQYSIAPSREQGGLLPWLSFPTPLREGHTGGLPLSVAEIMTELKSGETSQPVQVGRLSVIVHLEQRRPTQVPEFYQVRPYIRQIMVNEAWGEAVRRYELKLLDASGFKEAD